MLRDQKTARQRELEALRRFPSAVAYEAYPEPGVLLSDRIKDCVDRYRMIDPFNPENLKPAAYELSVGEIYSVGGNVHPLGPEVGKRELRIKPFEVAIIQTLERVNIPNFMIARWNIRVGLAYQGLMWVGGPQVDPGYKGYLACPIYNLSDKMVTLHYGEPLAVIDFVTTTTPQTYSLRYKDPDKRTRLIFEDFNPTMRSALAELAQNRLDRFEGLLDEIQARNETRTQHVQGRIDQFTAVTYMTMAVLVGAVAIIAAKAPSISSWNATFGLGIIAVCLGLFSTYLAKSHETRSERFPWRFFVGLMIVATVVLTVLDFVAFRPPSKEIERLQAQIDSQQQQIDGLRNAPQRQGLGGERS
jgi:deoxycytidine triphosphate deaminase